MNVRLLAALSLSTIGFLGVGCSGGGVPDENVRAAQSELRVCGQGASARGIDVSYWQGNIQWSSVAASGVEFAFARISDGLGYFNYKFADNWSGMANVGILRGAYQFFRPGEDPIAQANLFISTLTANGYSGSDLPPVLDLETFDGYSATTVADRALTWLNYVEQQLGRRPIIYTGPMMSSVTGSSGAFSYYPLWVANWTSLCPQMPSGWGNWHVWQYDSTGSIPGIGPSVDMNYFNGTKDEMRAQLTVPSGPPPASCASIGGSCANAYGATAAGTHCGSYQPDYDASCGGNTAYCFTDCNSCADVGGSCANAYGATATGTHCGSYQPDYDVSCSATGSTAYCFTDCKSCADIGGTCADSTGATSDGRTCGTYQESYDSSCAGLGVTPYCFTGCQ